MFVINKATLNTIVANNNTNLTFESTIKLIELPNSKSGIIQQNKYRLYAAKYHGLAGLFSKEELDTRLFGRAVCDYIKFRFSSHGFFTSDELPRYGITRAETRKIFTETEKGPKDLIILFAYDKDTSQEICNHLTILMKQLLSSPLVNIDLESVSNQDFA